MRFGNQGEKLSKIKLPLKEWELSYYLRQILKNRKRKKSKRNRCVWPVKDYQMALLKQPVSFSPLCLFILLAQVRRKYFLQKDYISRENIHLDSAKDFNSRLSKINLIKNVSIKMCSSSLTLYDKIIFMKIQLIGLVA